ncbi:CsgG/HfaB family protein [Cyanobium sp. FGCU-6]|jgi:curli biogenesis system outer membrane secretion channel CsgG|nr:CsgG/HfaB family protein [Cyanobium sp. FGCU6]
MHILRVFSVVAATAGMAMTAGYRAFAQPLTAQAVGRPSPTVSVPDFKNNVTGTWWWQGPVAQDLSHALANELAATGDIRVVERQSLGQVLSEQELAELGIVRRGSPTAAARGQMTGARFIILGTITSYETATGVESKGSGVGFLGFGGSKQSTVTKDYVAIDIRVVDSTTGEIVGSRTVEGRAANTLEQKASGGSLLPAAAIVGALVPMNRAGYAATAAAGTFNFSNNSTSMNRTPAAKAIRAALIEASGYVSCLLVPKGDCMAAYNAKDQIRRQNTLGTLELQ